MKKKIIARKFMSIILAGILLFTTVAVLRAYALEVISSKETAEYGGIFEKDRVIDIHVEVSEEDWKSMLSDPLAEEYKSAKVTIDGNTVENVGFRTKGNLSLRSVASSDSDRYSFRIKLDKYVKGQTLFGLDEFVVNNMYSDPSYMREYLSYEALREIGADVPLTAFANIYINGELYGFYLCVEAIDDSFLERNFDNDKGNLYKQEQGSTLQYVEGSNYDKSEQKSGKDETKTDLKNFIKVLNDMKAGEKGNIESVLDVDSTLKYIAANTVLGNYDSYNGNMAQNYYLYGQDGKFTVLPWDYNMSIGGFGGGGGNGSSTTIPIDEPVSGANIKNLPMINNLLAVQEYKERYHGYIKELVAYLENFEGRVDELAKIIRPYVAADPTKFYTMEQFETSIVYSETEAAAIKDAVQNMPVKPDESAGEKTNEMFRQPPQDQQQGMPPVFPEGERPERPDGEERPERPQGGMGENMKGGPGGRMGGSSVSIINYVKARVENIKQQLAGTLPTTGNTTMNRMQGETQKSN
ncbi:CotH kinase family protein [Geosporobacter ferrireducens]|uniref:Spore coat protein CotH n=1 Tax=Geosporobacter ferrireducens TaxID=1424294 RepID=A0A1D8GHG1_9FIRM|nr:CotH kinase family protein [Geosporobacter ferrireducens]AOT70339.1 spore coat protein CotH [Geosporobacter ferrireducens]MTI54308.1 spore coat protein CotH [Geosporobacter ferrireducens]